jgi:hypothetical protein
MVKEILNLENKVKLNHKVTAKRMSKLQEETKNQVAMQRSKSMMMLVNAAQTTESEPCLAKGSLPNLACMNCNAAVSVEHLARLSTPKPAENNFGVPTNQNLKRHEKFPLR